MHEASASPSGVAFSALGQDKTVKRPSTSSKLNQKSPYRGPPGGLSRAGSVGLGFLQVQKSGRRKTYLWTVVCSFLAFLSFFLVNELKKYSPEKDDFHELMGSLPPSVLSSELGQLTQISKDNHELSPSNRWSEQTPGESPADSSQQSKKERREKKRRKGKKEKHKKDSRERDSKDPEERENRRRERRRRNRDRDRSKRAPPPTPFNPLEPTLPLNHVCANFTLPPPPADPKRSGPRECPVCYLGTEDAVALKPSKGRPETESVLKELTFVTEQDEGERRAQAEGKRPRFAGHQSLEERNKSFEIQERMHVHCGFVWGGEPGTSTGFDSSDEDREYMRSCDNIVVASAIFGAYDLVQQPSGVSDIARETVCFVMFVDDVTYNSLLQDGILKDDGRRQVGLWRLVVVNNLPYTDPRRTGKIPKLLSHRLFPNAQFSIWVDAKLELRVDPYKILERFLWRGNFTWAISRHYARFDIFVEAERNKAAGKYKNASIDEQMEVYRREGMTPFSEVKMPIISDVPEGCVIVRELTPLTNLLACIWFNEVDRFTSRDQLSFGFCRDKIRRGVPGWNVNMFLDCERRNFVVQNYHKDVLKEKFGRTNSPVAITHP